ncbi:MAG: hypothetical protein RJA22_702 [Verrucomicrobiota bacterium]
MSNAKTTVRRLSPPLRPAIVRKVLPCPARPQFRRRLRPAPAGALVLALLLAGPAGRADVLVRYSFESGCVSGVAPSSAVAPQVIGGSVVPSGPVQFFECSGTTEQVLAGSTGRNLRTQGYHLYTNEPAAVAAAQYLSFSLAPASGVSLQITNVSFKAAAANTNAARSFALRWNADGFTSNLARVDPIPCPFRVNCGPGQSWSNLTLRLNHVSPSPVLFRLYGWVADGTATSVIAYDEILVEGRVLSEPTVTLTTPAPGTVLRAGTDLALAAAVANPPSPVSQVTFMSDGVPLGTAVTAPYVLTWANVPVGGHALTAVATFALGTSLTSAPVLVEAVTNLPPVVTLTAPVGGATLGGPLPVTLRAAATDPDGAVGQVAFQAGGLTLGVAVTAPYEWVWEAAPLGTHLLTAVATDNLGMVRTSAPVVLNIRTNILPTVSLTWPTNGAVASASNVLQLAAIAADGDGGVARVEFYGEGMLLGSDAEAPYTGQWRWPPAGVRMVRAVAVDVAGGARTSAPVSVVVAANSAPTVALVHPWSDAHLSVAGAVRLEAAVTDLDDNVARVEFHAGGEKVAEATGPPWRVDAVGLSPGWTWLRARAVDTAGLEAWSAPVAVALHSRPVLVPRGAAWRYLDTGLDPGTGWRTAGFAEAGWLSGRAQLGYGDGDEATVVASGGGRITTYFRHAFVLPVDRAAVSNLTVRLLRDDGAVVYLNGTEVFRSGMPAGVVTASTLAAGTAGPWDEWQRLHEAPVPASLLVAGTNLLAVEVHQDSSVSPDASFDLELSYNDPLHVVRGPYLQVSTPTSMVVRWRTSGPAGSRVRFGTDPGRLDQEAGTAALTTEHEVRLGGLAPETRYYYAVGTAAGDLLGGASSTFVTPPPAGVSRPVRIWALGDSGFWELNGRRVRDAFYRVQEGQAPDVVFMLGDNTYDNGHDYEYQAGVFENFGAPLRQAPLWLTLGNHDVFQVPNPALTIPYFQNFTLPTNAEAGGVPSGTEKYYSFDRGDIHFVVLDPETSDRSTNGPMLSWLRRDLATNRLPWLIAVIHNPPYSKGAKDSDAIPLQYEMRANAVPILEEHDVDLVLSGDSHNYERTYFMSGHYGPSSTFTTNFIRQPGDGRPGGGGAYVKSFGAYPRQGTVYVEAGNASRLVGGSLTHPAMVYDAATLGSLVIDVSSNRLDFRYVRDTGAIDDAFTLLKVPGTNRPPTVGADTGVTAQNTAVSLAGALLLANDRDPENGPLTVAAAGPASLRGGSVAVADGGVLYRPPRDFFGTDTFTYAAADTNGAIATGAVTMTVSAPIPFFVSPAAAHPLTGRPYQTLRVRNPAPVAIRGVHLFVRNLPPGVRLLNALGTLDGVPFLHVPANLVSNQFVSLTLEYEVPPGQAFTAPGTASFQAVVATNAPSFQWSGGTGRVERWTRGAGGEVRLELTGVADGIRALLYSSNLVAWQPAWPLLPGTGASLAWLDAGPPATTPAPGTQSMRFYRLVDVVPTHGPPVRVDGLGSNGVLRLQFEAGADRLYAVQSSVDLRSWRNQPPLVASTNAVVTWTDGETGAVRRFLRVLELPGRWR